MLINNASRQQVEELPAAIRANHTLTSLDIWNTNLGGDAVTALRVSLANCPQICWLSLFNTKLGDAGVEILLKKGDLYKLRALSLQQNELGDGSAHLLAKTLRNNSSLTWLDLQSNNIGVEGVEALMRSLRPHVELHDHKSTTNETLLHLHLHDNSFNTLDNDGTYPSMRSLETSISLSLQRNFRSSRSSLATKSGGDAKAGSSVKEGNATRVKVVATSRRADVVMKEVTKAFWTTHIEQ